MSTKYNNQHDDNNIMKQNNTDVGTKSVVVDTAAIPTPTITTTTKVTTVVTNHRNSSSISSIIIKGMINPFNHTYCYINTAIQIVCYISSIQSMIIQLLYEYDTIYNYNIKHQHQQQEQLNEMEHEFVNLLRTILYLNKDTNVIIDPTRFYSLLFVSSSSSSSSSLSSIVVDFNHNHNNNGGGGDAISTVIHLLQFLLQISDKMKNQYFNNTRNSSNSNSSSTNQQWNENCSPTTTTSTIPTVHDYYNILLQSGRMFTCITEYTIQISTTITTTGTTLPIQTSTIKKNRMKQLKIRSIWNPLPVPITTIQTTNNTDCHVMDRSKTNNYNNTNNNLMNDVIVSSLEEALYNLLCIEHTISNGTYQWSTTTNCNNNDTDNSNTNNGDDNNTINDNNNIIHSDFDNDDNYVQTTIKTENVYRKKYCVQCFPPILLLHLERFTIQQHIPQQHIPQQQQHDANTTTTTNVTTTTTSNRTIIPQPIEDISSHIYIPKQLNVQPYITTENTEGSILTNDNSVLGSNGGKERPSSSSISIDRQWMYELMGGILHIHDYDNNNNNTTDDIDIYPSIGHYVSVIRQCQQQQAADNNNNNNENNITDQWYVIDDENVANVTLEQVLVWFGGDWYNPTFKCDDKKSEESLNASLLYARGILLVYHQLDTMNSDMTKCNNGSGGGGGGDDDDYRKPAHTETVVFQEGNEEQQHFHRSEHSEHLWNIWNVNKYHLRTSMLPNNKPNEPKKEQTPKKSYWLDVDDDDDSDDARE